MWFPSCLKTGLRLKSVGLVQSWQPPGAALHSLCEQGELTHAMTVSYGDSTINIVLGIIYMKLFQCFKEPNMTSQTKLLNKECHSKWVFSTQCCVSLLNNQTHTLTQSDIQLMQIILLTWRHNSQTTGKSFVQTNGRTSASCQHNTHWHWRYVLCHRPTLCQ